MRPWELEGEGEGTADAAQVSCCGSDVKLNILNMYGIVVYMWFFLVLLISWTSDLVQKCEKHLLLDHVLRNRFGC